MITSKEICDLHTACSFGDQTAVSILLERGEDPNVKNDDGDTPLCVMARRGPRPDDTDIAGLLLSKGARVSRSGKDTTALIEAVRNRNFQMADVLLTSGNRIDSTDRSGRNVLHVICLSAGLIADEIRRTEERIADFSGGGTRTNPGRKRMPNWKPCGNRTSNASTPQSSFWKTDR